MISAIPGSEPPVVRVLCEEDSHHGRIATVAFMGRSVASGHVVDLTLNFITAEDGRNARSTHWHEGQAQENQARGRLVLRCPLCGLSATLTQDRASALHDGLMGAGVSEIRLSALAASL